MSLKEKLNGIVVEAVMKVCPGTETVVLLDKPANDVFGDFSTNVALTLASHNKKNPKSPSAHLGAFAPFEPNRRFN